MPPSLDPAAIQPQDRTTPPCPHFGSCGGCQLQHLTYAAQLRDKASQLRTRLEATGLALPMLQLHPSPPLAYRNRIRLTLAEIDGQLRAGYLRGSDSQNDTTPTFLPITECPIAAPILWRAAEALLTQINVQPALWLRNPQLALDQLEIFTPGDESGLQFTLFLRTGLKVLPKKLTNDFTTLCESLGAALPELTGAGIATLPALSKDRSRRNEQPRPGPTWGKPGLTYRVAEIDYWV
ncbi:MAG: 23S rRNA (uracil(1939)-C(5))-methyltransferase RlmD, partial [Acidobacteriaceae bacterium]